jgi:AcrR family transcriptional regulator
VSRTSDPAEYALRKQAFLDAAQHLIQTKGYAGLAIDDVLRQVGVTKGALYYYFDSKAALLEGVVERMGDAALAQARTVLADPKKTALEKFEAFIGGVAAYEIDRRDLILGYLQSWLLEENAALRDKLRRGQVARLQPVLEQIVRQGIEEGVFAVTSPEDATRVLVSLWQGMGDDTTELMLGLLLGTVSYEAFERRFRGYVEGLERILGARPGSLRFPDLSQARDWQRWAEANWTEGRSSPMSSKSSGSRASGQSVRTRKDTG